MRLLSKLLGNSKDRPGPRDTSLPASTEPAALREEEDDDDDEQVRRHGPRRELVQLVLSDTLRKHGIPSDWIDCSILTAIGRSQRTAGLHVMFLVRGGEDRLLGYIHAFQDSFREEILRIEPRAADWLYSLSWQFEGHGAPGKKAMPDPASWGASKAGAAGAAGWVATEGGPGSDPEDELDADLKALYAIRDAALRPGAPGEGDPPKDFEPTRPGGT